MNPRQQDPQSWTLPLSYIHHVTICDFYNMEKIICFVKIIALSASLRRFSRAVRLPSGAAADKGVAVAYAPESRKNRRAFALI